MATALDVQDYLTLTLPLDLLAMHVEGELSEARRQNKASLKQLAMLGMRQQVNNVRGKLRAMEGGR